MPSDEDRFLEAEEACKNVLETLKPLKDELQAAQKIRMSAEELHETLHQAVGTLTDVSKMLAQIPDVLRRLDSDQILNSLISSSQQVERELFGKAAADLKITAEQLRQLPEKLEPLKSDEIRGAMEESSARYNHAATSFESIQQNLRQVTDLLKDAVERNSDWRTEREQLSVSLHGIAKCTSLILEQQKQQEVQLESWNQRLSHIEEHGATAVQVTALQNAMKEASSETSRRLHRLSIIFAIAGIAAFVGGLLI